MATTADDDARANLLKGLGVARRRDASASASSDDAGVEGDAEADADADAEGDAEADDGAATDPAKGAVAPGLGIRRRKPAAPGADPETPPAAGAAATPGSGLGITRRKAPEGGSAQARGEDEAPAAKPRRKLGNDQVAVILANYFRGRPLLELPERVFELKRTHGFYNGDDRPERKLVVGFEPALVLYVLPVYPEDIYPTYVPKTYEPIDPGLHRQPKFVSDGFIVDLPYNVLGEGYLYVAFRSDGQPLELPDTSAHVEPVRKTSSLGLGIKRRK